MRKPKIPKKLPAPVVLSLIVLAYGLALSAWLASVYASMGVPISSGVASVEVSYVYPPDSLVMSSYPPAQPAGDTLVYFTPPMLVNLGVYFRGAFPVEVTVLNASAVLEGSQDVRLRVAVPSSPVVLPVTEGGSVGPLPVSIILDPRGYDPREFAAIYAEYARSLTGGTRAKVALRLHVRGRMGVFGMYREVAKSVVLEIPASDVFNSRAASEDYSGFRSKLPDLPATVYVAAIYVAKDNPYVHMTNLTVVNPLNGTVDVAFTTAVFVEGWSGGTLITRTLVGGGRSSATLPPLGASVLSHVTVIDGNLFEAERGRLLSAGFNVTVDFQDIYTVKYRGTGFLALFKTMRDERYPAGE